MTSTNFAELGLAEPLLRALTDAQYTTPTPIQAQSIPILLAGGDLLGLAETGTGKTAAFVLPILHHLAAKPMHPARSCPRALIVAPTRELAIQIGESIATYGRHVRLSHTVIFGGVGQHPQVRALQRGVDILVATPGRLLDLLDQRHVRLDGIGHFVLDEADRMLDMGFVRDVRRIIKLLPAKRQSLLFSATMPDDVADLANSILNQPQRVEIARVGKTADRIDQRVIFSSAGNKRAVLNHLLQDESLKRVIVFTRTKRGADRVSRNLEMAGIGAHAIHGNKSQGQRQNALESFRKGFTRVLVATDIAARGIDIDDISHVVNYELPNIPESYVHRIGRTARAGAEGIAISLCAPDEREYLRDIEKLIRMRLAVVDSGLPRPAHEPVEYQEGVPSERAADEERAEPRRPERQRDQRRGGRSERRDHAARGGGRPERREHSGHGGDRRERGDGQRGERRDGFASSERPQRNGDRSQHADRPQRSNDRPQPSSGHHERREYQGDGFARQDDRDNRAHARGNGERRERAPDHRRDGGRDQRHERRDGAANAASNRQENRGGERRRERETSAAPAGGRDTPQPWRNWTGDQSEGRGNFKRPGGGKPRQGGGGRGPQRGKGRPSARPASQGA